MNTKLVRELCDLGIRKGDILLVHSSLRALGPDAGGADSVLATLRESIGREGTLVMPSFPSGSEYDFAEQGYCFDLRNTPSGCGYLTEFFRCRKGVLRSASSTHSMAAEGPAAEELLKDHEKCIVTTGWGSPFGKLIRLHGKILMLGAGRGSLTMMHHLENTGGAPTVSSRSFLTRVITMDGRMLETPIHPHFPGLDRDYSHAVDLLEKAGGVRRGKIGDALCELYDSVLLRDTAYQALKENPCAFIRVFNPAAQGS